MVWAYAPKRYAIEYSKDGASFHTLIDWRDAIVGGTKSWWSNLIPALRSASRSFPDRITFDNPIFIKKLRVVMKGPVNYYFGFYRVDIFVKNWVMVIKNTTEGQCKEDCWVINTVSPGGNTPVKSAECVGTIGYSENRELFTLLYDSRIVHNNSGLCVISGFDKDVKLENCGTANFAHDGRDKYTFESTGEIKPEYAPDECLYKETADSEAITDDAVVEASSEMADGGHNALRTVDGNEVSYWASNPGDTVCTLTLYFKKWESMNDLTINWKYKAENFDIWAFTLENGWKLIMKIKGNTVTKNNLKLNRINARAIQIKMNTTKEKFLNKPIYGLTSVEISDGAFRLKRKLCTQATVNSRQWILDDQYYYYVGNKPPYMAAYNELSKTYLKLRKLNKLINNDFKPTIKSKAKAQQISSLLEGTKKALDDLRNKIKLFETEKYSNKNISFEELINKFKIEYFYPYYPKLDGPNSGAPQIGSVFTSPGKDCWHIKQLIPFKKSGYYWIKPKCTKKSIRVFCDFSIDGLGTSIFIWKSKDSTKNTPIVDIPINNVKDIQKQCAMEGLYPIEIHNINTVVRITQYLETLGYNLALPLVFPLGFDWGCESQKCSLTYKSISDKSSPNVSSFFPPPEKAVWDYNKISKYNGMGIGYNKNKSPCFFNLGSPEAKIGALICSTNSHVPPLSDPTEASLTCSDVLVGNAKIDGSIGTKVKVLCPSFCKEKSEHKIYGKDTFSDNSSICRAAIYSGMIQDTEGGSVMVVIGPSYQTYKGNEKNGLVSHEYKNKTNKSFTLESIEEKCPIDFFKVEDEDEAEESKADKEKKEDPAADSASDKPVKTSVPSTPVKTLQFDETAAVKSAAFDSPQPQQTPTPPKENSTQNDYFKFKSLNLNEDEIDSLFNRKSVNDRLKDAKNKAAAAISNAKNALNKKKDEAKKKLDAAKKAAVSKAAANKDKKANVNESAAKQGGDPNTSPVKSANAKKEAAKKAQVCIINTDGCIKDITDFRRMDYTAFKHYEKFGGQMLKLIKEFKSEYAFGMWPSKLSNKHFQNTFAGLTKISTYLHDLYSKVRAKGEERIKNTKATIKFLEKKKAKFYESLGVRIDYSKSIESQFNFFHYKKTKDYPGLWKFVNSNLEGRANAVQQSSQIKGDDRLGTIISPTDRRFFDFKIKVDIMTRARGSVGIVFRMVDPFNFLAFELNIDSGYKRVIKVQNGAITELKIINDGGLSQNNWFKVMVRAQKNKFTIRAGDAKKYVNYNATPIIFEFEDISYPKGE